MKQHSVYSLTVFFSFVMCLLFSNQDAKASHAMGADITYEYIGPNQYLVTFSFYRDCTGIPAPSSIDLDITNSCGFPAQSVFMNPLPSSPTQISPVCSTEVTTCNGGLYTGIEEWIYQATVTLPGPCADWNFSHGESARNSAITTITGAGSDILYVYTQLNNTAGLVNNSPIFSNRPVPFACVGQRFCLNPGAYDIDGDSLSYQMITPLTAANSTVTYLPGYTSTQPVLSSPAAQFSAVAGDLCITPTQTDVTVLAILVNEYRNGVLIGQVERDIQLTVNNCNNFLPFLTGINGAPSFSRTICAGQPFSFYIASIDTNAADSTRITWDQAIPGATFTVTGHKRDSAIFSWTPSSADISSIPKCFTATVMDNRCPYQGLQIFSYCFTVIGVAPNAGVDQTISCNTTTTLNGTATGGSGNYTYTWLPSNTVGQQLTNVGVGTYYLHVKDNVNLCENTDTVRVVPGAGVPAASFNFTNNCSGTPIQFTDQTVVTGGAISQWSWDFGDLGTSNLQNPTHQYAANGSYNVTLIVFTATGCSDTITQQLTVNTNIPTASFNSVNVCQGTAMSFSDASQGGPFSAWSWNFGDAASGTNTSVSQNPSHSFSSSGTFSVTLEVTNAAGCQNQIQQDVTVYANPTVTVADAQICEGGQTTLTAPNGFSSYSWAPGGNTQSINVNPVTTSTYTITVTDSHNCLGSDPVLVTVNPLPVANAGTAQTVCEGTAVNLNGAGGASYVWTPGNLNTQNVNVTPATTTTYTLTVTSAAGCIDADQVTITVNPMPTVDAGNGFSVCKGSSVTLAASTGAGNYLWLPGNFNTSSISVAPLITTTYTVTVSDAIGCSGNDTVTVVVNPIPVASFTNSGPVCVGNSITFTDGSAVSSGTISTWNWAFDNSQTSTQQNPSSGYSTSGNFNVQLIVTSNSGCKDTTLNVVRVNPLPVAEAGNNGSICPGFNATLTGSGGSQYLWNPGGFTTASITVSPALTTAYTLQVTDANGCQNTDQATVVVNPVPVANAGTDQEICLGEATTLFASGGATYSWTPGNANTSNFNVNPNSTTTYDVLVINSFGCRDNDQVTVTVHPIPVAAFANSGAVCQFNDVTFTDNSSVGTGSLASWSWDFGNNVSSSSQNPVVPYNAPGTYTVSLIIASAAGCRDTISHPINIWAKPVAVSSHTDVCFGNPVNFSNTSSISDATPLAYSWDLGDNTLSSGASPSHQYASYGNYQATLLVTSVHGCTDEVNRSVNVFALPDAAFSTSTVCEDALASFTDGSTIADGNVSTWYWTFGDGNTGAEPSPGHTYTEAGNYPIHLLITSNHGCQDSTDGLIRIIPKPVVDFQTLNVCFGNPTQLTDFSFPITGSITQYQWAFGDGSTSTDQHPEHLYAAPGWYQVGLTATTDSGCSTTLVRPNAVNIYAAPVAQFISDATNASDIYPLVNFVNETVSPGFYYWSFGDGATSTEYSPAHQYPDIGVYDIQLITVDYNGCVDTTVSRVEIRPSSTVYIPTAFTPNNDTKNDVFHVYTYNVVKMEAAIYDRWGLKIYEWDSLNGGWDGKIDGNPVQSDTYVYRVSTLDVNNKRDILIGHVSVVR
ncbi:MAG: PKD domain-containing protein [Bacteroidia bacterium]|nr:PKD domain-containing protein [Bacteroidia bacterium]MBP6648751.1 PKD domain-containing protein [Bacteroidia bacterium]